MRGNENNFMIKKKKISDINSGVRSDGNTPGKLYSIYSCLSLFAGIGKIYIYICIVGK